MGCNSSRIIIKTKESSANSALSAVNDFVPRERNRKLSKLIQQEMESLKLNKEIYDSAHPNSSRNFSDDQLWRMARTKVLQKLCEPEGGAGSE